MKPKQLKITNALGDLYLVASAAGLRGIYWERPDVEVSAGDDDDVDHLLREAARQIDGYLDGARTGFDLPLDLGGTDFQRRVWAELAKIPFGETRSYRQIAAALGNPKACRAVGTANGRNPVCIVVPCHRVIAADGTLGGYAGGLPNKRTLLALEGVSPR